LPNTGKISFNRKRRRKIEAFLKLPITILQLPITNSLRFNRTILSTAAAVIAASNRENTADQALRKKFASDKPSPEGRRAVTFAVFAYYRWYGWLTRTNSVVRQIDQAIALDAEFKEKPQKFTAQELAPRAVPGWTRGHMERPEAWLRSLQEPPKLWIRTRNEDVVAKLGDCEAGPLPNSFVYKGEKDLFLTPEFKAGEFEIQDIASQAVGHFCAPKEKETWWDACAGEGGKTLHLSALMRNTGLIWSSDRAEWRLANLKKRAARAGVFNYRAKLWDGSEHLPTKTMFDGILIDAPCTGIGTWGRNPQARWTTTVDDVNELAQVQLNLLVNASVGLKTGGKLIYSVCTLTRRETTEVVEKLGKILPHFRFVSQKTIWPQDLGGNGMFIAAWTRIA
jgi:16S rRNA (cytosine967-C5)-methyltransferase